MIRGRRIAGRWSSVPVGVAVLLLVACAVAGPLYVSSAASAATRQQLDDVCPSHTALALWFPASSAEQEQVVADLGSTLSSVRPVMHEWWGTVQVPREHGLTTELAVLSLPDQGAQVTPPLGELGPGEVAMSATNAVLLGLSVGDEVPTTDDLGLRLVAVFDDLPFRPAGDYWCGWAQYLEPDKEGDPPPPFALASTDTARRIGSFGIDEHRLIDGPLTLTAARKAADAFAAAAATMLANYGKRWAPGLPLGITGIVDRATSVRTSVSRTLAPVEVTALVGLTLVLVAASVLLARARRSELRLLVVRGVAPPRLAARVARSVAPTILLAAAAGGAAAFGVVRWFGPSTALESRSLAVGGLAAALATIGSIVVVGAAVAFVADRGVDAVRRHRVTTVAVCLGGIGLAALAATSFHRLDRDGGVRSFGVTSRGGDLLPMAFPLLALLACVALGSLVLVAVAPRVRLTGRRLGRAVRLGWRRVVMEGPPLAAIVAAVALAAGCLLSSSTLARGSRDGLRDKAEVYVGSDLWVAIYDDPAVVSTWSGSRTTVELTGTGRLDGDVVEVVGIDRSTFAGAARLRPDASSSTLAELVASVAPTSGGPVPAIVVGSELRIGDVVTVQSGRGELEVTVVATPEFFPGKTSHAPLVVVDDSVLGGLVQFPVRVLLVDHPPADAVGELQRAGVRTGVVRAVDTAFDGSAYSALRWAYAPLTALGFVFAAVALALQLLVVSARMRERRAAHVLMRRTGFTTRALWVASFVEAAIPLAVGVVLGVVVAYAAARLAVPRLDPMPSLAPSPIAATPWAVAAVLALAIPLWSAVIASLVARFTVRTDPLEVMHGAL